MTDFTPHESLGSYPPAEIVAYLRAIGDDTAAETLTRSGITGQAFGFPGAAYLGTDAIVGFIDHGASEIRAARDVTADQELIGKKLKITLDRFYVEGYPGFGQHRILCEFTGKNQQRGETEELNFAITCTANNRQGASVLSLPIFMGIAAGPNGISFEGRTVNVRSSTDDAIIGVLDSDVFKQGLELIDRVQPAIRPLATLAHGVVKMAASRSLNKQIHNFMLGLDFTGSSTSARLRRGSYIVLQTGGTANWDWSHYRWDGNTNKLVKAREAIAEPSWNYMVFGVSIYEE